MIGKSPIILLLFKDYKCYNNFMEVIDYEYQKVLSNYANWTYK